MVQGLSVCLQREAAERQHGYYSREVVFDNTLDWICWAHWTVVIVLRCSAGCCTVASFAVSTGLPLMG